MSFLTNTLCSLSTHSTSLPEEPLFALLCPVVPGDWVTTYIAWKVFPNTFSFSLPVWLQFISFVLLMNPGPVTVMMLFYSCLLCSHWTIIPCKQKLWLTFVISVCGGKGAMYEFSFPKSKNKYSFLNLILVKIYHRRQYLTIRNRKWNTEEIQGYANQGQVPHSQLFIFSFRQILSLVKRKSPRGERERKCFCFSNCKTGVSMTSLWGNPSSWR